MPYHTQPFVILAGPGTGTKRETRHNPASAMCLADDWEEAGYQRVRIVNQDGTEQTRQQFRAGLPLVKKARLRALALA